MAKSPVLSFDSRLGPLAGVTPFRVPPRPSRAAARTPRLAMRQHRRQQHHRQHQLPWLLSLLLLRWLLGAQAFQMMLILRCPGGPALRRVCL